MTGYFLWSVFYILMALAVVAAMAGTYVAWTEASSELYDASDEERFAEDTDILRHVVRDAYAAWEGSNEDMFEAIGEHLASRVTIHDDVREVHRRAALERAQDDF